MTFNTNVIISQWNGVILAEEQSESGTESTERRSKGITKHR